jgi:predicted GIY-YIG superfamily endonuclease
MQPFWVYIIQCGDGHFYTGQTDNLEERLAQHHRGDIGGYTSGRKYLRLAWTQEFPTRDEAIARERQIKRWTHAKKLALIRGDWEMLKTVARSRKSPAETQSAQRTGDTDAGTVRLRSP